MDNVLRLLQPGDEVLASDDLYGGSYRLLTTIFAPYGITSRFIDITHPSSVEHELSQVPQPLLPPIHIFTCSPPHTS